MGRRTTHVLNVFLQANELWYEKLTKIFLPTVGLILVCCLGKFVLFFYFVLPKKPQLAAISVLHTTAIHHPSKYLYLQVLPLFLSLWLSSPRIPSLLVIVQSLSNVRLFVTAWTVARQCLLSIEFSRQECWSGFPFPSPGDLPEPRIEPGFLVSSILAGRFFTTSATWEALLETHLHHKTMQEGPFPLLS